MKVKRRDTWITLRFTLILILSQSRYYIFTCLLNGKNEEEKEEEEIVHTLKISPTSFFCFHDDDDVVRDIRSVK